MVTLLSWFKATSPSSPHRLSPLEEVGGVQQAGSDELIRSTWRMVLFSLVPLLIWAGLAEIGEVAHVTGQVLPSGAMQTIQHLEGGMVAEVLVHDNQLVEKDQVLLRFDSRQTLPEKEQMELRQVGLDSRLTRLRAFAAGREPDFSHIEARFASLVDIQQRIYQDQMRTLENNMAVLEAQVAQRQAELAQVKDDLQNARHQVKVTADMVKIRKELLEHQAISRVLYLETLRAHLISQGEVERLQKQETNIQDALSEAVSKRPQILADLQQEAVDEIGILTQELGQVREAMTRLEDQVNRLELRAPVRGMVQDLQVRTPASMVQAGQILMHIVPMDGPLKVETHISPMDVGRITLGKSVMVKLTGYDFSNFGTVAGTLVSISPSSLTDESNNPYFRGMVTLDHNYLGDKAGHYPVLPGMLAQVDIAMGERSVLESIWRPIARTIHDAFKER